ncbi:Hypothetical predicted protein [Lecanosticta acicola]|uniref:Uncharacterized protein n=1 Tax=Lecanosticta acicola TaxID=111012 RepID=A0AAI8YS45_9PEZI|nr:Hypothetical predicted protein [Lecanosticta acicola]
MADPSAYQPAAAPEAPNPVQRMYRTPTGKVITVPDAPEPIAQRRQTFPNDATIDTVISPQSIRPSKSLVTPGPTSQRPPSPGRANTWPSAPKNRLTALETPIGCLGHVAAKETYLILDPRRVSTISGATIFDIGTTHVTDTEGKAIFCLRKSRSLLSLRRQYHVQKGFKIRKRKGGSKLTATLPTPGKVRVEMSFGQLRLAQDGTVVAEVSHAPRAGGWSVTVAKGFDIAVVVAFVLVREM